MATGYSPNALYLASVCLARPSSSGASDCEATTVSFEGTSGKGQNVGVAAEQGNLRISGQFRVTVPIRLDRASVTIADLLDEVDGVGGLPSRRPGGGALLPITLPARAGSKPTAARYQTASSTPPSVNVEVRSRDAKSGLMEFSITVDRDSMPVRPSRCVGSHTQLRTSFTLDDDSGQPLVVDATLPWQCRANELRFP